METIKNEINTSKVEKVTQPTITKKEDKTKSPFSLKLEMSVMEASIVYEKVENEFGGMDNTDIEKGVSISYVNLEEVNGEDVINEQSVYIDYKWDMFKERGIELINSLKGNDIKLLEPQENDGLFAKGYEKINKTTKPYFILNRSMKMKIMTIVDKSSTFNNKTTTKTEIATIFKGVKMRKIAINLKDIPKSQVQNMKNKEVLVENITIYTPKNSFKSTYSSSTLPKEI